MTGVNGCTASTVPSPPRPSIPTPSRSCSVASVSEVLGLKWDDFVNDFKAKWQPGEHISVIAPTGAGKTTFVAGILGLRRYVLALDPKGGDETLAGLRYRRLDTWPGERGMERLLDEDG